MSYRILLKKIVEGYVMLIRYKKKSRKFVDECILEMSVL